MLRWYGPFLLRYGAAIVATALATWARMLLEPVLPGQFLFSTFFLAVLLTASYGGLGPALLAVALGALSVTFVILPAQEALRVGHLAYQIEMLLYVTIGLTTGILSGLLKMARQRAGQMGERLRVTLASLGEAVISTDSQGRITFLNAVAQQLTDCAAETALGNLFDRVFTTVDERSGQAEESLVARVLKDGTVVETSNSALVVKNGQRTPIESTAAPIRGQAGSIEGVVVVFQDVTERKRTEERLRLADRRKDEFLATLSHELRNPLASIQNALEILKSPDADERIVGQAREIMSRQLEQLVRLVDDLLDVSRITQSKIQLRKEMVDLGAVVAQAIETAQPLVEAQQHQLTVSLPPEPVRLRADPIRVAQVIANLLNNAAKYSNSRGHIWLNAWCEDDQVVLQVRDTGIGISPEILPHVFDMYVQAEEARDRTRGGMGIGLTLVRRLIELHGGTVRALSDGPGKGSEFVVRLPRNLEGESTSANETHANNGEADHHREISGDVLIVDDNIDAAATLKILLKGRGYAVEVVHDGPTALRWTEEHSPSTVLLDIGMPGMDGYEVARRLRQQPRSRDLFVVAISGWGQEEDRRRSAEAGINYLLVKPVQIAALENLLAERRSQAAR